MTSDLNNIMDNLHKLRSKFLGSPYPDDEKKMDGWESAVKTALKIGSLRENDGIRMMYDKFVSDLKEIDQVLRYDRDLTESQRLRLMDKREDKEWFVKLFQDADTTINNVDTLIKGELKHLEQEGF